MHHDKSLAITICNAKFKNLGLGHGSVINLNQDQHHQSPHVSPKLRKGR